MTICAWRSHVSVYEIKNVVLQAITALSLSVVTSNDPLNVRKCSTSLGSSFYYIDYCVIVGISRAVLTGKTRLRVKAANRTDAACNAFDLV